MLKECHSDTWFSTRGISSIVASTIGTIPGDPLGDIIYNFISIRVHKELEIEIKHNNLLIQLPPLVDEDLNDLFPNDVIDCVENLYVDDATFFCTTDECFQHVRDVCRLVSLVYKVYRSFLLDLNMKANKSEVQMNLCGPGATACRHRIINQLSSKLPFDCDPFADEAVTSTHTIRVVAYYKHMGAASTARGSMTLEAKARAGSMFSQLRKGRARLYSNVNITVEA